MVYELMYYVQAGPILPPDGEGWFIHTVVGGQSRIAVVWARTS